MYLQSFNDRYETCNLSASCGPEREKGEERDYVMFPTITVRSKLGATVVLLLVSCHLFR